MKKKITFILAGVNGLLLVLIGICLFQINDYAQTLLSQRAAEFWKGGSDGRFAQVSAFLPVNKTVDENTVRSFSSQLDSKLRDAGVEEPEEGSLWTDAFSGLGSLKVEGDKGAYDATVIGVGGNFFFFHPYELLSGSYISESDLMQDRVVLDYDLAWKLFGSSDLAGMSVTIGGKPYYIAGVVRRESDELSEKAFSGEPVIFMSYTAASENIADFGINCYELVMADPISNYAESVVTEGFVKGSAVVVQNTGRYSFGRIFDIFQEFGSRAVSDTGVIYPYWENAARVSEIYIARIYVIIAILAFIPLICLIWLVIRLGIFVVKKISSGWAQGREAWDDRYARMEDMKLKTIRKKSVGGKRRTRKNDNRRPDKKTSHPTTAQSGAPAYDEKAVALDIESIVREIMEENE